MDIYEHETAEILWRRIVDIRNGAGPEEDLRAIPATAASSELRELTALAEDLQRTLVEDPAFAEHAARARFVHYLSGGEPAAPARSAVRRQLESLSGLFRGRSQVALALLLLLLAAAAVFAWTIALRQPAGTCGTDSTPAGGGAAAPAAVSPAKPDPGADCAPPAVAKPPKPAR